MKEWDYALMSHEASLYGGPESYAAAIYTEGVKVGYVAGAEDGYNVGLSEGAEIGYSAGTRDGVADCVVGVIVGVGIYEFFTRGIPWIRNKYREYKQAEQERQ